MSFIIFAVFLVTIAKSNADSRTELGKSDFQIKPGVLKLFRLQLKKHSF